MRLKLHHDMTAFLYSSCNAAFRCTFKSSMHNINSSLASRCSKNVSKNLNIFLKSQDEVTLLASKYNFRTIIGSKSEKFKVFRLGKNLGVLIKKFIALFTIACFIPGMQTQEARGRSTCC